jgi:hypothetical protein
MEAMELHESMIMDVHHITINFSRIRGKSCRSRDSLDDRRWAELYRHQPVSVNRLGALVLVA